MFSVLITGLIYPVFGSWAWGGLFNGSGWLERLGFIDFAGSTVVHSVGWAQVGVQAIGIGAAFVWTFGASYLVFSILEATVGLRVGEESEHIGLDEHEHEISAYPEFASNGHGEIAEKVST